ncbi:dioxygenase [Stachybotrys elegans]|uniref:Dioxygenase n=1 Tax=Stachybotrys elegans TaxID=80388 RepID=A0A8K0WY57_9HYPO|nr:dioxygenase [Stachybotrys elegans]
MASPRIDSTANVYDQAFTKAVIAATGDKASPRLKKIMPALVSHLHAFAREVDLTLDEWFAGVEFINKCGQMSNDTRNETQLLCNVLGLETLVDAITTLKYTEHAASASTPCTPSSVLGPFYRHNAPLLPASASIVSAERRAEYLPWTTHFSGRVLGAGGRPIAGAVLDIWHTAPNGMYEQQDEQQPDMDLRGRFTTDAEGKFALYCLRPVAYPIPDDGPVGKLLHALDRHPWRPAHIHAIVSAEGHRTLTTQLYDAQDKWLHNDSVFAVHKDLIVDFKPYADKKNAAWAVSFDFVLGRDTEKLDGER